MIDEDQLFNALADPTRSSCATDATTVPEMEFDEFTIALLVSGPTPNTDAFQDAHLAHLASLHDAGSLLAAGPLSDPARELRGLSILSVPVAEARRLKEADDAVRAGVFSVRVLPWRVPAGAISFSRTFFPRSMRDVTAR